METENELLKDQFIKVLQYSQSINCELNVDPLFATWKKNKEYFYKAFGNKLIWEYDKPLTFHLDAKQRKFKYTCFVEKVESFWNNSRLAAYLRQLSPDDLFNNLVSTDVCLSDKKEDTYKYKGTKLLKTFKYFEDDKNILFDMQNEASRIIQEDKVHGILCFSIHPLDFLSLSENHHQWRSCHALDGDYRAGNLSYMCDESTFICYLRSEDGNIHKLPNFPIDVPWNSKKWRRLLFLSNDRNMLFAGRPYPFSLDGSLASISQFCTTLLTDGHWSYWSDWLHGGVEVTGIGLGNLTYPIYDKGNRLYLVGNYLAHESKLFQEPEEPLHFNDLTISSCYTPWYCYRRTAFDCNITGKTTEHTHFNIGHDVPCPVCGQRTIQQHDVMMCMRCWHDLEDNDNCYHCECCGNAIHDDDYYIVQGSVVCPTCYEEQTKTCQCCGERFFNENIKYHRKTEQFICQWCLQEKGDK